MSLTSTYMVASTARSKLGREAGRADHNLRLLVGHANLLDSLMVELQEAEREQEAWFNQSVRKASKPEEPRHIQWMDEIAEAEEDDSDDESDFGEEDEILFDIPVRKLKAAPVELSSDEMDEDMEFDEDSDDDELALQRTPSKHSPPELSYEEEDSDSEDECPSPEDTVLELSEKQRQAITTTAFYDNKSQASIEDYVLQRPQTTIIAAAC